MPGRESMLVFGSPLICNDEISEVVASLRSGWIGTGPKVARFEEMFKEYTGVEYAAALNSCTAALHLSLLVSGVGPGDEVITTPMTFCATANAVVHAGATPVFVDVDRESMNLDPGAVERAITSRTRALLPVHFAGRPCDLRGFRELAEKYGLVLIEDAAHCIEGARDGVKVGANADLTCFSFYVTKNVVTAEGGMVTTSNPEYARKIKMYGLHGMSADAWQRFSDKGYKHYQVMFPGFKYNMTDIQASLGMHQLPRAPGQLTLRAAIWARYDAAFSRLPITTPAAPEPNSVHARHLYTILVDEAECGLSRDGLLWALRCRNIGTGVHYTSLHVHPYYRERFGFSGDAFPNAQYIGDRTLSLPLSAKLSDQDVEDVIAAVRDALHSRG